jgi:hypothetical protein
MTTPSMPRLTMSNLPLDLGRIGRTVTDVYVAGLAEPKHQMSRNFGLCRGVEQG